MKLVVLLVVLALRRLDVAWPQTFSRRERFLDALAPWRQRIEKAGLPAALEWALMVLVPVAVVALVMYLLHGFLWGLPGFIAGGLLLLWLLGTESEFRQQESLLERGRMNDPAAFAETAERYFGVTGDPEAVELEGPGYFTRLYRRILCQDARQLFATIFWLVVLGYWAALLYVLNLALAREEQAIPTLDDAEDLDAVVSPRPAPQTPAQLVHTALFWLPSRLLVLCLALAGSFGRVADAIAGRVWKLDDGEALLEAALEGALERPDSTPGDRLQAGVDRLEELQGVLLRCLAIWLILAALWIVITG